ncbi:DUF4236 domain-containing protein [Faecalicatena sp. BF-R-105]|nr:DUF4236 domain-containing protein [Faecalicatena sp. BF-R-105]
MGFRYRKSINLGGGFRINLSKSGVGYSWGTKGYRITKTASGKTRRTYSIPGTGLSYVSETGQNRNNQRNRSQNNAHGYRPTTTEPTYQHPFGEQSIKSAEIKNFQSAEFGNITSAIERTLKMNKWGTILLWCVLLVAGNPAFILLPIIGGVLKVMARSKGAVNLEYDFDAEKEEEHDRRVGAWIILAEGAKEWQILIETYNSNTKVHAGAGRSLNRVPCTIKKTSPYYLKTNVALIQIKLKKETLLILPDKVFIIRGTKVGAVNYDDLQIQVSSINFVESDPVPKDAQVIGQTWQYVNKNGTPDKRYKNNRQLPICLYGVVRLRSTSGINVEMHISNIQKSRDFDMLIR